MSNLGFTIGTKQIECEEMTVETFIKMEQSSVSTAEINQQVKASNPVLESSNTEAPEVIDMIEQLELDKMVDSLEEVSETEEIDLNLDYEQGTILVFIPHMIQSQDAQWTLMKFKILSTGPSKRYIFFEVLLKVSLISKSIGRAVPKIIC